MAKIESEVVLSQEKFTPVSHGNATIDIGDSPLPAPPKKTPADFLSIARSAFKTGKTKLAAFRKQQLRQLVKLFEENSPAMEAALMEDLGRPKHEALSFDIELSKFCVQKTLMEMENWMKPEKPSKPLPHLLDSVQIVHDPYGVVLIVAPWNFPINLAFVPMASAIAGGNCVILKPSEVSSATAELIERLVPQYLDKDCYQVYLGGVKETQELLEERFDYIFFTGSTAVGKVIHAAANKFLTPVTLELGGKSPTYIDKTADLEMAVKRILWGKLSNAGQICIAPDYILCSKEIQQDFIQIAKKILKEWYGSDVKASSDYARIISSRHYERLVSLLDDKKNIAIGGQTDSIQRYIAPTVLVNVSPNDPVMLDEIFGPILPIVTVENPYEAVRFINAREKPLVIYVFTKQNKIKELFIDNTSSGAVLVNDTLFHFNVQTLPFGGVGYSGMGAYHGKEGFSTFVHRKSVMKRDSGIMKQIDFLRYPPYSNSKTNIISIAQKPRRGVSRRCCGNMVIFLLGAALVIMIQVIYYYSINNHLL